MANPTGHTVHLGERNPLEIPGGPRVVYRDQGLRTPPHGTMPQSHRGAEGRGMLSAVEGMLADCWNSTTGMVRNHPMAAMGIGMALGFMAGRLLTRGVSRMW